MGSDKYLRQKIGAEGRKTSHREKMKKKAYAFKIEQYKCLKLCHEENFIFNGLTYFLHDVAEDHDIQDIWLFLIFTTDLALLFTMLSVDMPIHCRMFFQP